MLKFTSLCKLNHLLGVKSGLPILAQQPQVLDVSEKEKLKLSSLNSAFVKIKCVPFDGNVFVIAL